MATRANPINQTPARFIEHHRRLCPLTCQLGTSFLNLYVQGRSSELNGEEADDTFFIRLRAAAFPMLRRFDWRATRLPSSSTWTSPLSSASYLLLRPVCVRQQIALPCGRKSKNRAVWYNWFCCGLFVRASWCPWSTCSWMNGDDVVNQILRCRPTMESSGSSSRQRWRLLPSLPLWI